MKSVNLDRKLSTTAKTPKRSTVVESPVGRAAHVEDGPRPSPLTTESSATQLVQISTSVPPPQRERPSPQNRDGSFAPPTPAMNERPGMTRSLTAVRVVDEHWSEAGSPRDEISHPLGDIRTQNEEGITLADLPAVMEAEQAREQHRPVIRQTQVTLLSELSALEYIIVKHVAAMILAGETSPVRDLLPPDDLMDLLDARKNNNFWGKIFKGGTERKGVKKRGANMRSLAKQD